MSDTDETMDDWLSYAAQALSPDHGGVPEWLVTGVHARRLYRLVEAEINRRAVEDMIPGCQDGLTASTTTVKP